MYIFRIQRPHLVPLENEKQHPLWGLSPAPAVGFAVFFLFCSVNRVAMKTGINNGTGSASCCQQSGHCSALVSSGDAWKS